MHPQVLSQLYDSGQTARITDVTPKQLRYWIETEIITPIREEGEGHGKRYYFDFLSLISIRTIVALRQKSLSLQRIRKAIRILETDFQIENPLEKLSLFTDGETVFILGNDPNIILDVLRRGQSVFAIAIDEIIQNLSKRLGLSISEIKDICTRKSIMECSSLKNFKTHSL